jgi:hypothetical protein
MRPSFPGWTIRTELGKLEVRDQIAEEKITLDKKRFTSAI